MVRIDEDILLGNFIISRSGKCITIRQFKEFLEFIDKNKTEKFIINIKNPIHLIFEDFSTNYGYLVVIKNNVIFPIKNIELFKRYFRIGLPKDVINVFDLIGSSIKDNEEDLIQFKKAYQEYMDEYKKIEMEKEFVTNSLNKTRKYIKKGSLSNSVGEQ